MITKTYTEVLLTSVSHYISTFNTLRHDVSHMKIDKINLVSNEEIAKFLNSVIQLLNQSKLEFVCDLSYLAIDFIFLARAIFGSKFNEAEINSKYFQLSCDPIRIEQKINEFNTNIISIRLNDYLKYEKYLELKETEIVRCVKCSAIVSIFTQIDRTNKWKCNFCNEINTHSFKKINQTNVFYKKKIDLNAKKTSNKNNKIVVFCLDISISMSIKEDDIDNDFTRDDRLYIIKKASIELLNQIYKENSDFKVILIAFSSKAIYYGHGDTDEIIEDTLNLEDIASTDKIQPIKNSFRSLEKKINQLKVESKMTQHLGNTYMKNMLYKSVQLAASCENSDVIIFTDGKPQDDSKIDVDALVDYCKLNGLIRIHFLTFSKNEIDAFLRYLCYSTDGKIIKLINAKEFKNLYEQIFRQSNNENIIKQERFKLKLQCNNEILLNKTMLTEDEILIELNLEKVNLSKSNLFSYFQFEFDIEFILPKLN